MCFVKANENTLVVPHIIVIQYHVTPLIHYFRYTIYRFREVDKNKFCE